MFPTWALAIILGVALGLAYVVLTTRYNGSRKHNVSGNVIEQVDSSPLRLKKQNDEPPADERSPRVADTPRRAARHETPDSEVMTEISQLINSGHKTDALALLQANSRLSITDATARIDSLSLLQSQRAALERDRALTDSDY